MLLKKLIAKNYGPFSAPTEIRFESDVTVLTGANDTGKTSLLNLIERICRFQSQCVIGEQEVNVDRFGEISVPWQNDPGIACEVIFLCTHCSSGHIVGLEHGDELQTTIKLAPQAKAAGPYSFRKQGKDGWSTSGRVSIKKFPIAIRLPFSEPIRTVIDLGNPNAAEAPFLQAAFGPAFSIQNITGITDFQFAALVSKARGDVNDKLRSILPPSMHLELDLQTVQGERQQVSIQLRDRFSGHTPLSVRGAGVQRIVSVIGGLLSRNLTDEHFIILFDEPETSLHADAQHTLRMFLEGLGERENIQVIYTTHSPSMLNTLRPASIRVLRQAIINGKATSEVVDRPIDDGYRMVRSSLGITASDSLLFAPVTLIVEGPTEAIGLPLILGRLCSEKIDGFGDVSTIQQQCHIVDGSGDSWEYLCRVAKSFGTKPIVFLDGDKRGARLDKLKANHPDVPIVLCNGRHEFEDIVPKAVYFDALQRAWRDVNETATKGITPADFEEWEKTAGLPEKMAFTKRVARWLESQFDDISPDKPLVMKIALQIVKPADVQTETLRELVVEMLKRLR